MPLSVEDRLEIQDVMVKYAYLCDYGGTEQDFLDLFTLDLFTEDATPRQPNWKISRSNLKPGAEKAKTAE